MNYLFFMGFLVLSVDAAFDELDRMVVSTSLAPNGDKKLCQLLYQTR